jgi:hypothetical protein
VCGVAHTAPVKVGKEEVGKEEVAHTASSFL